ncbi:hypothetical protein [Holospora curviuscula]|uniref:Uncharacterized protein n=1 Tax=Holospora curviuscula TaxID=1082868 RepID=A0A2S5R755_9PROT|nr:hypothetical protein [Holospora curviuscula]PPE03166.1 hypothetical protein HCUR_01392 [Holospora curviuscula]
MSDPGNDEANQHNTVGGCNVFQEALQQYPTLKGVCVDAGYGKTMIEFLGNVLNKTIEISEPQDGSLNEPLLGSMIIQDCLKRTKWL